MEQDFYTSRLENQGIEVVVPDPDDRKVVHDVIYNELCLGVIKKQSQQKYAQIVDKLISSGVEGIILGCTEICMLIGDIKFSVPVFDTTAIHAKAAVDFSLS
ncbi:putative racemase [Acinetobacter stercoris]|uniref:Putative racemase n=1 Tax=Acinetobacter stercoris TaxID=2126983 RepID=A0A2U3N2E1_9GAMM|nr:putative racemase [Acinetobacter stercoris]